MSKTQTVSSASKVCQKSLTAGAAAVELHTRNLGIEGPANVQLWHLLASLLEWSAANGIDFDGELANVRAELSADELDLPAAKASLRDSAGQARVKLIGELIDYAERFAESNDEPEDGDCRQVIKKAQIWFETGSSSVDIDSVKSDLIDYVERYAESNNEPAGGDCRRLLARARG